MGSQLDLWPCNEQHKIGHMREGYYVISFSHTLSFLVDSFYLFTRVSLSFLVIDSTNPHKNSGSGSYLTRFLGHNLKLEVSVYNVYVTNQF